VNCEISLVLSLLVGGESKTEEIVESLLMKTVVPPGKRVGVKYWQKSPKNH
jgi:hypothetical protein